MENPQASYTPIETTNLKEIMTSFIQSIDFVNYLLKNHHRRVAVIANAIGLAYGLDPKQQQNLVLAASLHDIGALTIEERDQLLQMDIENPHPHAILGSMMLAPFSYFKDISKIIKYHHVYWDQGHGPLMTAEDIPIESYLLHLSDRIDILIDNDMWIIDQIEMIRDQIIALKGSVFTPEGVKAFVSVSNTENFWLDIENVPLTQLLDTVLLDEAKIPMTIDLLEELSFTLSRIIDYRSEFTATHSYGVAMVAHELGRLYGLDDITCRKLRIAGYLHDIGKIAVPTEIVEKPSKLNNSEYNQMKAHVYYSHMILKNIRGLEDICNWASLHHERLDGTGYPFHLKLCSFTKETEILAYADIFTALTEHRPYRDGKNDERVLRIIRDDIVPQLGGDVYTLIEENIDDLYVLRAKSQTEALSAYREAMKAVKTGLEGASVD